jgi:hypothetical protein
VDGSEINRLRFAVVCVDDRHTGVAQRSVNRKHAHYRNVKIDCCAFNTESTNAIFASVSLSLVRQKERRACRNTRGRSKVNCVKKV